ncbi:MAG: hypothetical protein ACFFEN_16010 [Candidatus Thorarchaeota archaeon]
MADIFNSESVDKNPNEYLCVVYVLYFDEKKGQVPLLMYPDDRFRSNKKYMRPIHYHPIWFLETEDLDHIDLEYKGYTFFGKKFSAKSERKKRRAGLDSKTPETIVIIVSLPMELAIFGDDLIRKLTEEIRIKFEDQFFEIIESEIAKEEVIKTPKIQERINSGNKIKVFMRELIDLTIKEYFANTIQKEAESRSIRTQKAISYFSLKRFEVSPLSNIRGDNYFENIEIFDPSSQSTQEFIPTKSLSITNIALIEISQEIEVTVQNNTNRELNNISIAMTHLKEYFEKEIMNLDIDLWFPQEELLFVSPIVPHINEYLFTISQRDEDGKNQKILIQRIDLNLINKISS